MEKGGANEWCSRSTSIDRSSTPSSSLSLCIRTLILFSSDIAKPQISSSSGKPFYTSLRSATKPWRSHRFSVDHAASDPHIVRMLAAIRLPSHVGESEEATRWRQERYSVRLSERGWGLLLGWLQGGGLAGSIEGTEARGRDRVLAIINERVKVDGTFLPLLFNCL